MSGKYTDAQRLASKKYQKKLVSYSLMLLPEVHEYYKTAAKNAGIPLRQLILQSMDEKIERDGLMADESQDN